MAYTEYLDVVIRNQGKLDALEKQTKRVRDNLEAINRGPAAGGTPRASDQLDSRSAREVRQESRRNLARDRVRIASPSRQLAQAVRGVEQALESVQEQAVDRLNDVAEQITQGGRRGGRRGGSFRRQPAGGGGSGGPPDDPDRFRRRVGQVQTRERFAERYGPQLPDANAAERSLAYQARLNAQVRQYSGQLIKARQIVGPARQEVERISRAWEEAGGAQIRSLTLAQAYSRELRALNTEQVQARAINQFVERGPGQRALIEGRARAVANELPEAQRPALLDSVRTRLRAQEEALDQGNRSEAFQQEKLAAQEIALRRQEVAERKRAEVRARAPQQARVASDKALRLSRQANDIQIPRGTPLGDELFQQSATIAEQSSRQRQALQRSIRSGTATVESVRALTNNINELRSAFETLKTRAQPLQQAARAGRAEDVARRKGVDTETQLQQQQRDRARKLGGARDAAIQKQQQDELTAFQKSVQLETQLQQQQRDRARKLGQARDKGIQDRQREEDKAFAKAAEGESKILQQQRDRARKLGGARDAAIQEQQREQARNQKTLANRAESLSLRAEGTVANARAIQQDPSTSPALRDRARQAEVIAQGTLNKLSRDGNKLTSEGLTTEGKRLSAVKQRLQIAKQQAGVEEKQQKAQREGVSLSSFKKNVGRVLGGGGDTQDFESIALGAGFPLLFGGGPGSVAGGVLGSFVGKGFGGQILGGAIGQIVDDLIASTARLGNALNSLTGDFSALRAEGVRVSAALELQIKERKAAGDFAGAEQQLRTAVGAQQGDVDGLGLKGVTAQVNALSASWDKVYKTVGLTVGIIASPFLAALSAVLEVVNAVFAGFNSAATAIAALINTIPAAAAFGKFVSDTAFENTPAYQEQLAAIQATNDELVRRGAIEQRLDVQRSAASGLTGASKVLADAQIAAKEKELALDEEIRKIREDAPLNEKLAGKTEQTVGIKQQQFLKNQQQEALRTQIAADAASLQTARELEDRERSRNRETEALLRRQEDLAQAQVDQARQEFDLQRSIADFRIRIEDQIASKRADAIRQELEIAKIRGQIEDSQISSGFDRQIEAAPNDQSARILRAAKEEELARKALERTIRDGRIETTLRIDQIERQSRQEQRALENERIALERQRDSVIRARIGLERQTEDLKRDTADYQLSIARQIEDSAIRAANELRAAAAGLLQGFGGAGGSLINGGNANAAVVTDTLRRKLNLPDVAIAGLLGNLEYESPGLNPRALEGGGEGTLDQAIRGRKGYGISQLTSPDRQQGLLRFAGNDLDKASKIQTQAEYLVLELTRNYASTLQKLRSAKTVAEAVQLVQDEFLRPDARAQNTPQRLANAQRFLSAPGGSAALPPIPVLPPPPGGAPSGNNATQLNLLDRFGVAWQSQLDNASGQGWRECFTTVSAMIASGAKGRTVNDDDYARVRQRFGDTTSMSAQLGALRSIGVDAKGTTSASKQDLIDAVSKGMSVGIGVTSSLNGHWLYVTNVSPEKITAFDPNSKTPKQIDVPWSKFLPAGANSGYMVTAPRALSAAIPGIGVGTAPFDLKAQEERNKQLQRDRQKLDEELQLDILRRREEDTLQEVIGENSIVRKREELTLATRIADAGIQSTETEQRLLELRIASTREQEILAATVAQLGPINAERQAALDKGLANKREELRIAEALLEIEKQRGFLQDLVNTQREIQNLTTGIDAGFGVGTQASAAFAGVKSRDGTDAQARAQADAVRTLTLLQETIQDAQAIGSSIGDGVRNALISSVTGGDIGQAFGAMFATIGNTLIQSALRPIEQLITDQAFNLLRPNLTQELVASQQIIAAQQNVLAGTLMQQAATQFMIAAQMLTAQQLSGIAGQGFGLAGQLVGSLFSGAGPVSFPSGGLATNIITDLFTGALGFAGGGNPPIGQPSWVGEQGPELSVARGLSTIIPNETSNRLWDSLSNPGAAPDEGGMAGGEVAISYDGPTLVFDSTEYVQKADVPKIVDRAVKQSFGYSQQRMRNSPADRRAAGMR